MKGNNLFCFLLKFVICINYITLLNRCQANKKIVKDFSYVYKHHVRECS